MGPKIIQVKTQWNNRDQLNSSVIIIIIIKELSYIPALSVLKRTG